MKKIIKEITGKYRYFYSITPSEIANWLNKNRVVLTKKQADLVIHELCQQMRPLHGMMLQALLAAKKADKTIDIGRFKEWEGKDKNRPPSTERSKR